jgi:hypothetical protein
MNDILDIKRKLELTNEALSRLRLMLRDSPHSPGILANMKTLERTYESLEKQFTVTAKELGYEACSYRLFQASATRQSISTVGQALVNFQSLFTIIYDAIKRGQPKRTAHIPDQIMQETLFEFGYTYPGSVGIVFTLPSEATLYEHYFDEAITALFSMTKANTPDLLHEYSRTLGIAAVRAMYTWAHQLAKDEAGLDIKWKSNREFSANLFMQWQEFRALTEVIQSTSEDDEAIFTVEGILQGADVLRKTFHFEFIEDNRPRHISGSFIDAISPLHSVELPKRYRATIKETRKTFYSTQEDQVRHTLLGIESINEA